MQQFYVIDYSLEEVISKLNAQMKKQRILLISLYTIDFYVNFKKLAHSDHQKQDRWIRSNINILMKQLTNYALFPLTNSVSIDQVQPIPSFLKHITDYCRYIIDLRLSCCKLNDQDVYNIFIADWKFLKRVNLSNNNITQKGAKIISQCQWKYLTTLGLNQNKLTNKGLQCLLKGNWTNLTKIAIKQNQFTPQGVKLLLKIGWKYIQQIQIFERQNQLQFINNLIKYLPLLNTFSLRFVFLDPCQIEYRFDQSSIGINFTYLAKTMKPRAAPIQIYHDILYRPNKSQRIIQRLGYVKFRN